MRYQSINIFTKIISFQLMINIFNIFYRKKFNQCKKIKKHYVAFLLQVVYNRIFYV